MTHTRMLNLKNENKRGWQCADLIIDYLARMHIDYVFGVPGGAIEPLYNALAFAETKRRIRSVVARHETGAAFMADGYARETGKMGVCCATTGPGSTNLLTGVTAAYADNIPLLVITAQVSLPKFGRNALQDSSCSAIDTVGMLNHCTKYSTLVSHPNQLETKLISALMTANTVPRGPVHLSIPSDILRSPSSNNATVETGILRAKHTLVDHRAIDQLMLELKNCDSAVLFIGDGCEGASQEIMHFAEQINAPFVTGPRGKRWVDETHSLYRGVFGFAGHETAITLLKEGAQNFHLVIAIGTCLSELGTRGWDSNLLSNKLIHIDDHIEHFTRSHMAKLHVCGNLPTIFHSLNQKLAAVKKEWKNKTWGVNAPPVAVNVNGCRTSLVDEALCLSRDTPIKPQKLFTYLSRHLPPSTRVFLDAGNAWSWGIHYYQRAQYNGKLHIGMGLGAMAWAIGASIGSSLGSGGREAHLCITGDGSYLMSSQELTVAKQWRLPWVVMVLNDAVLGMVMHGQRLGGAAEVGYELGEINFAMMAQAMGVEGIVLNTIDELESVDFNRLFTKNAPTLIDIRIDKEAVPPMADRVKGIAVNGESVTPGG